MSTVLIPTDGSPAAEQAIDHGVGVAARFDGTVHGLYAIHLMPTSDFEVLGNGTTVTESEAEQGDAALDRIERQCDAAGVTFERHLREGDPTDVILSLGKEIDPDLITMGTEGGTGLTRRLLGSTTVGVLREKTAPVLAVPGNGADINGEYDTILVATDGSGPAKEAASMAFDWAQAFDADIHGLYVVEEAFCDTKEVEDALEADGKRAIDTLEDRATEAGLSTTTAIERGVPNDVIRRQAESVDAELIVLGRHGRSGIDGRVFGSVSERTVRTAERPVLVV